MNSFYIYPYKYKEVSGANSNIVTATVIFCSSEVIEEKDLQIEIKKFYETHYQTDRVFVIGSKKIVTKLLDVFINKLNETFKGIPKRQETFLADNLFVTAFDKDGILTCENGKSIPRAFLDTFKNEGLQHIFIQRGGFIVSEMSHHYVFPSGKHCDRFLRTGNILLYSPEIYFIAYCLLGHFKEDQFSKIYCDTSSINTIAFALFDLKNSFLSAKHKVSIESFSSYEGLYKKPDNYSKDSFLLVSASTSANILKYILDKHKIIDRDNIVILYFLAAAADYSNVKDQVLCNLTLSEQNPSGIPFYPTYNERDCEFCRMGSYAVPVSGDVFLLEKPKINKIMLSINDREKNLSNFVHQFMSYGKTDSVFKVHYKEASENKYEIYIDFAQVLINLQDKPRFEKYKDKLEYYISQYVPANTKYILSLNDQASKDLAGYMFDFLSPKFNPGMLPVLLDQESLQTIDESVSGSIVVVGSCIANGKNLLYISRALRKFNKLKITYFIGIARTVNKEYLTELKSSLKRGRYGADTNVFVEVETIFCSNSFKQSPWVIELAFLKDMILFLNDNHPTLTKSITQFEERKSLISGLSGDDSRGITVDLFYKRITTSTPETLEIRKNFAFFDFDDYFDDATQADVYFTISNVLNTLRNSDKVKHLKQAVYTRNILDPGNFDRLNDGVIQASILRAACPDELAYSIDNAISTQMYNTLETIIEYHDQEQGEALLEFLFAIAIKKLSLSRTHLELLLKKIEERCREELFSAFALYIKEKLITEPERIRSSSLDSLEATTGIV